MSGKSSGNDPDCGLRPSTTLNSESRSHRNPKPESRNPEWGSRNAESGGNGLDHALPTSRTNTRRRAACSTTRSRSPSRSRSPTTYVPEIRILEIREGHKTRRCRRVSYLESYITKYTAYTPSIQRMLKLSSPGKLRVSNAQGLYPKPGTCFENLYETESGVQY